MKKIIYLLILLIFICGCNEPSGNKEHIHTYDTEWTFNDQTHFHKSNCEHDIKSNQESHQFIEEVIKEPTHIEKGQIEYTCSVCGYVKTIELESINHNFNDNYSYDEETHYYECSCGEKKDIEMHQYEEGEIVNKETYFQDGLEKLKCKCGSELEKEINEINLEVDSSKAKIFLITTSAGADISNSVGISWHCVNPGSFLVYQREGTNECIEVKPDEEYWSIEESYIQDPYQNKRYVCTVDLTDLDSNTKYIYKIINGNVASNDLSFKTADNLADSYSFLSFVDFQYSENQTTLKLVQKFVSKVPNANLITCSGDITDEGYSEKSHRHLFDSDVFSSSILGFGVGDHEYWGSDKSPIKMFKKPYSFNKLFNNPDNGCDGYLNSSYYFRYNTTLFAFLDCGDSNVSSSNEMFVKQANWLDKVLSEEKDYEFIVVCMHKSLYGDPKQDSTVRKFAPVFTKVFDKHKVDLVISGHDHEYSRTKPIYNGLINQEGTIYLDLGNSGNKTRATGEDIKTSDLYDKYIDIKANNYSLGVIGTVLNGKLTIVIRDLDFKSVDRVEISKKNR